MIIRLKDKLNFGYISIIKYLIDFKFSNVKKNTLCKKYIPFTLINDMQ